MPHATSNGEKATLRTLTKILTTILLAVIGWLFTQVIYQRLSELEKNQTCMVSRTEWAARNVYVDNQLTKMRDEQGQGFNRVETKIDAIMNHLMTKK